MRITERNNTYRNEKDPDPFDQQARRTFTRYRTIDIDIKKDLVKILEGKQ